MRHSLRALGRSWGLNGIAVLSLAIGIGANSAVFSAVDVFMLRPLPYPDSERLYLVWISNQQRGWEQTTFSVPDEYFALPANTWDAGDEVRIYFKETGKALRLMNISKTDIFKK